MGLFTPLPLIGAAAGGILGGVLNDYFLRRTTRRRWARSGIAFTGKFVAAGLVLLSVQMVDGRVAMVVLLAARIFGDWSLPTQWGTITEMSGRASGTVFSLVNTAGAIGGFVAGPVLGNLKDHFGWEGLFLGVAIMCLRCRPSPGCSSTARGAWSPTEIARKAFTTKDTKDTKGRKKNLIASFASFVSFVVNSFFPGDSHE